jgi:hypothetical protein
MCFGEPRSHDALVLRADRLTGMWSLSQPIETGFCHDRLCYGRRFVDSVNGRIIRQNRRMLDPVADAEIGESPDRLAIYPNRLL